jgi:hypothetical protein
MKRLSAAAGLLMLLASPAFGADGSPAIGKDAFVAVTQASVSVNAGLGYLTVQTLQAVKAGTQVMANETGHGWIIYCGCDEEILPGKVYTVENRECKVESVNVRQSGLPHVVVSPDGQRGQEEITRCRKGAAAWWALGGAGVAVGICAAAGCFNNDNNPKRKKPASP